MVEDIEELSPQLQVHPLGQSGIFEEREVQLFEARAAQGVAPHSAKMTGTGNAVGLAAGRIGWIGQKSTGRGEGTEVQEVTRQTTIVDRTDNIGPVETLAGTGVVAFKKIVDMKGLAV